MDKVLEDYEGPLDRVNEPEKRLTFKPLQEKLELATTDFSDQDSASDDSWMSRHLVKTSVLTGIGLMSLRSPKVRKFATGALLAVGADFLLKKFFRISSESERE